MNFALVLMVLMLCSALAVDAGYAQWQKREVQNAADAAALGALIEQQRGGLNWAAAGQADAALNGFVNGQHGVSISVVSPPTSGSYVGQTGAVQAIVTQATPTIFLRILQLPSVNVAARAVAASANSSSCVYALSPTMSRALTIGGGGSANLGCGVYVDSSSPTAGHIDGGGSLTAKSVSVVGGWDQGGPSPSVTPVTGSKPLSDPLASASQPVFQSCDHTNFKVDGSTGSKSLYPGTYCGGISVSSTVTATFLPGLYVITGGINWNGQSTVNGSGVTLFFTQGGGSGYGQVTISGQVKVNLSAPTTSTGGSLTGILMFGDRGWNNTGQNVSINGGSSSKVEGILYFPTTGLALTGNTSCNGRYMGVIADNVTINGGAGLNIPAPDYSGLSGGSPLKGNAGLVE